MRWCGSFYDLSNAPYPSIDARMPVIRRQCHRLAWLAKMTKMAKTMEQERVLLKKLNLLAT
jgi:hypothetical protein